jgi:hypothetical protein
MNNEIVNRLKLAVEDKECDVGAVSALLGEMHDNNNRLDQFTALYLVSSAGENRRADICDAIFRPYAGVILEGGPRGSKAPSSIVCTVVAENGKLTTLKWTLLRGLAYDSSIVFAAASRNDHDTLDWLLTYCPWAVPICLECVRKGNVRLMATILARGFVCNAHECLREAARAGNVNMVKTLFMEDRSGAKLALDDAVGNGNMNVVRWLLDNGVLGDESTTAAAVSGGYMRILRAVVAAQAPYDERVISNMAVSNRQWQSVRYGLNLGLRWSEETFELAAGRGDVRNVVCMHEEGCPWDARTCVAAAASISMQLLKMLRSKGCPWDSKNLRKLLLSRTCVCWSGCLQIRVHGMRRPSLQPREADV